MRVGGKVSIKTNARFIFATNKDLKHLVEQGLFREDLYRRISAFEETVPSLEDRKIDLPPIIEGFIRTSLMDYPFKRIEISDMPTDLLNYLMRITFPVIFEVLKTTSLGSLPTSRLIPWDDPILESGENTLALTRTPPERE